MSSSGRSEGQLFSLLFPSLKIRPLKVGPPAINWKSSLYENFHPFRSARGQ